jgi:putative ABC transport system permease protein
MYMLADALTAVTPVVTDPNLQFGPPSYELWVPVDVSEQLVTALQRDVQGALGSAASVQVNRQDYAAYQDGDPYLSLKLTVGAIAGLVLLLGALGLVNIALVTLKQRIREIGIRRSFGATAGRVFFSVMMESVVATVVAGIVGVIAAVLIVKSPFVEDFISQGQVTDFPPFPVEAAVIGLVCATAVGALAGLVPALVAVRVKVIDAIRY